MVVIILRTLLVVLAVLLLWNGFLTIWGNKKYFIKSKVLSLILYIAFSITLALCLCVQFGVINI